jgi:hypothetical protein
MKVKSEHIEYITFSSIDILKHIYLNRNYANEIPGSWFNTSSSAEFPTSIYEYILEILYQLTDDEFDELGPANDEVELMTKIIDEYRSEFEDV